MVVRSSRDRRRRQMRQSTCKTCVTLLAAAAIVIGPLLWERITSIASLLQGSTPTWRAML